MVCARYPWNIPALSLRGGLIFRSGPLSEGGLARGSFVVWRVVLVMAAGWGGERDPSKVGGGLARGLEPSTHVLRVLCLAAR